MLKPFTFLALAVITFALPSLAEPGTTLAGVDMELFQPRGLSLKSREALPLEEGASTYAFADGSGAVQLSVRFHVGTERDEALAFVAAERGGISDKLEALNEPTIAATLWATNDRRWVVGAAENIGFSIHVLDETEGAPQALGLV